jgi:hypothetical protein
MRACNSGSVPPIEGPVRVLTGSGWGLVPTGRTSAIALSARTAVVVVLASIAAGRTGRRARAGRPAIDKLPETGRLAQGTCDRVARRACRRTAQLREPGISGLLPACAMVVALGSPAADTELPHSGEAGAFAVVAEVSAAVGGAVVGAGRTSS